MFITILFAVCYFGFIFGYPILQLWTLFRFHGWWRAFSIFCLIPTVPFYVWSVKDLVAPETQASLGSLGVAFIGPVPMLYLTFMASGYEAAMRQRMKHNGLVEKPEGDAVT
jgi:hypothetical protein